MNTYQHYIDAWGEVLPSSHRKRQLLRPLNNLDKRRIVQKEREPTLLENNRTRLKQF